MLTRRYAVVAAVVAVLAIAGSGTWLALRGDGSSEAPPAPRMTARVDQFRTDEPIHQLRATFGNQEAEPVFVETLQLVSPDFEVLPPVQQDYELPPNGTVEVSLRTKYGPAICDGEIRTDARPATAVVRIRHVDGSSTEHRYPLSDKHDLLGKLLRDDCETQKIESSVEIAYGDAWELTTTPNGAPAVHNLLTTRLKDPDATVEIVRLRGSVLYDITAPGEPAARLDAQQQSVETPLLFTKNNRCDPHALTASQQSYVFMIWVRVNDSEPISAFLVPETSGREALAQLIELVCSAAYG